MPALLTYPGVYVEEQSSGVRTIAGVSTSTTLFVGMARRGPLGVPVAIRGVDQFEQVFGDDVNYGELNAQVRQFFINRGTNAIVVRAADANARGARITLQSESGADDVLELEAKDAGLLGNEIRARVDYDTATPELTFNIELFRQSVDENGAEVISENEVFSDVSMNPSHPRFADTILDSQSALVSVISAPVTPGAADEGFSQSGLRAASDAQLATAIVALVAGGSRIAIAVDGGSPVTATLPVAGNLAVWTAAAEVAIDAALTAGGQPGSVTVESVAFGGGRSLRITSSSGAGGGQSVVITPAAQQDASAALQLGSAAGGIEIGAFSRFRPAPTGYVTRINQATTGTFANNTNLNRIGAFAAAPRANLSDWELTVTSPDSPFTPAAGPAFPGAGATFLEGDTNGDGDGSLLNVATHLDTLAANLAAGLGTPWTVRRYGLRIALEPNFGGNNAGEDTELVTSNGGGGGVDIGSGATGIATASAAQNTAMYSLGDSGSLVRQVNPLPGLDGGVPILDDYQDIFSTVDRSVFFNLMVLPRGEAQTDANRAVLWGPASSFCLGKRAFLIVDPPSDVVGGWTTVDKAAAGIANMRLGVVTDHAAIYWPPILVGFRNGPIDPAGTVAGIMARTDTRRGVWKAPAGVEARTLGATGFKHLVTDAENGVTNPEAINTLRQFSSGGVVWGARTMAGAQPGDYMYTPVRRTALFIEESLYRGLKFAVFEPNDYRLWAQIRLAAGAFMQNLFRQGAFQGEKKSDAYEVRCDETTTTQNDINLGVVNVIVLFAPLRPAEFVRLIVKQLAGQVQT